METIKEIIVVEGRDDTAAIKRAVDAQTIETHGFGMSEDMWRQIDRAARTCGIIVLTDPDYPGEFIRRKIRERYPNCKEAFLPKEEALRSGNVGVENASPESIRKALARARAHGGNEVPAAGESRTHDATNKLRAHSGNEVPATGESRTGFTREDLLAAGLVGPGSRGRREQLGNILGIGYGNGKTFLVKLNGFGITRREFQEALEQI